MSTPTILATYKADLTTNNPSGWDDPYKFNQYVDTIGLGINAHGERQWYIKDNGQGEWRELTTNERYSVNIDAIPYPESLPRAENVSDTDYIIKTHPAGYTQFIGIGHYEDNTQVFRAYCDAYNIDLNGDSRDLAHRPDLNYDGVKDHVLNFKDIRAELWLSPTTVEGQ